MFFIYIVHIERVEDFTTCWHFTIIYGECPAAAEPRSVSFARLYFLLSGFVRRAVARAVLRGVVTAAALKSIRRDKPDPSAECVSASETTVAADDPLRPLVRHPPPSASHPGPPTSGAAPQQRQEGEARDMTAGNCPRRLPGYAGERRGVASETNPDKHGSWTLPAARDCRRGECLVTAYCRNALPCAIPDCRDRATTPQRPRTSLTDYTAKSARNLGAGGKRKRAAKRPPPSFSP